MYKIGSMPHSIQIGFTGETNFRSIEIDMTAWMEKMPAGVPSIIHIRPGEPKENAYIAATTFDTETNVLTWVITAGDIGTVEGDGEMQIWLEETESDTVTKRGKSVKVTTKVEESANDPGSTPPEYQEAVLEQMTALKTQTVNASEAAETAQGKAEDAQEAAEQAAEDAENVNLHPAYIDGTTKHWMVYDAENHQYVDTQIKAQGQDATPDLVCLPYEDLVFPVSKGTLCYYAGDLCKAKQDISTSEAWTAAHWDVTNLDVELRLLKTAIQGKPDIKDSTKTGVDFDLSDADGNVILRVQDGDVLTKWFTSKNPDGSVDYNADIVYSNTSGTKSIAANFREGDNIILHLADANDRIKDSIASSAVTYKYTDTSNVEHTIAQKYGYLYVPFTFQEDAVSVSVTYSNGLLWGENGVLRFSVYKKGIAERKPHIIRVAADGSGDYTSLRDAIDSIEDNNAYNRYRIEVYPGTYNILADYTAEEINESGFEGLFVGDGISIVGIGQRDDIILYGTIDTNTYNLSKRNDISTINLAGNVELENITINTEYLRYCVHDDKAPLTHQMAVKEIKNCVFNAANMTTGAIAYGCGISNMRKLHFKDCVFNQELHIHTANTGTYSPEVIIENCEGMVFSFADYNSVVDVEYMLPNSKFTMVKGEISYGPHNQFLFINQTGAINPLVDCDEGMIYNLANCFKAKGQITAGQLVSVGRSDRSLVATAVVSSDIANGVSIGHKNGETIIASHGYINSNQVGITGLSVGDYITVDANGVLTDGGTQANAVGVVTGISERQAGGAFIKLFV